MVVTQSSSRYAGSNWGKCRCRSIAQRWHQSARDLDARRSSPRQYRAESQPHRAPPSRSQLSMGRMVAGRRRRECAACSMSQPPRTLTALVVLLHLEQAHRQSRSPSQRAGRAQRPPASVIYSVAPSSLAVAGLAVLGQHRRDHEDTVVRQPYACIAFRHRGHGRHSPEKHARRCVGKGAQHAWRWRANRPGPTPGAAGAATDFGRLPVARCARRRPLLLGAPV